MGDLENDVVRAVQLSEPPKGPYFIQMNMWLLEKASARPLPNPFGTDWIDCFVFVYTYEREILLKSVNHGITWRLEVGEIQPVLTNVNEFEGKGNIVHLTGILGVRETTDSTPAPTSTERELVMSFRTTAEKKEFNGHIKGWAWVIDDAQPPVKVDNRHYRRNDGIGYKGPYLVQMNRFLLDKSAHRGKFLDRVKTHWIDCFLFAYPADRKILVYHSLKPRKKAGGITWRFEVGNKHPVMTDITRYEQRANVLQLTDILEVPKTASKDPIPVSGRARELMLSFKTSPDRKEFINHIKGWVLERKVTRGNRKSPFDKPKRKSQRKSIFFHLKNAEVERNHRINRTLQFVQHALKRRGGATNSTTEQMVELVADQTGPEEKYKEEYEGDGNDCFLDYIITCTSCHKKGAQGTYYETSECTEVTLRHGMITGRCPKSHTFRNTVDD